ncbi:hypothetical protein G5I_10118 [Acromyrmex echinatior]|uniref:Uncharacterized protein n=1 Tax=Acromyrmex echinatior TaxID=103372 RepID=F4WW84_ACREC|nr:hypothetical protein G5I_10118 [Acromyrmex echinatior]
MKKPKPKGTIRNKMSRYMQQWYIDRVPLNNLEILVFEELIPNRPRRNDQTTFKDSLQVCKLERLSLGSYIVVANERYVAFILLNIKAIGKVLHMLKRTMLFENLLRLNSIQMQLENFWNHQRKSRKRIRVGTRLFKCSRGDSILTQQLIFKQRILIKQARVSAGLTGSHVTKNYIF